MPWVRSSKSQRVAELLAEARTAVDGDDYAQAKMLLSQVLRMDSQNADAKKLMAAVDQYFNLQKAAAASRAVEERSQRRPSKRGIGIRPVAACTEALQLDAGNSEVAELLARANAGKQTQEQIQQLLREAESARHSGNYESAQEFADKASELDPADSRILAICKVLEQEAEEERRKTQMRKLLQSAQESLAANRLDDASKRSLKLKILRLPMRNCCA